MTKAEPVTPVKGWRWSEIDEDERHDEPDSTGYWYVPWPHAINRCVRVHRLFQGGYRLDVRSTAMRGHSDWFEPHRGEYKTAVAAMSAAELLEFFTWKPEANGYPRYP